MRDADYRRAVEAAEKGGAPIEVQPPMFKGEWVQKQALTFDWASSDYRVAPEAILPQPMGPKEFALYHQNNVLRQEMQLTIERLRHALNKIT